MGKFKFDVAIGNPPYQEETDSESTRMPPVYNLFMDEAYKCAEKVELITPARFLFNAGFTPKKWNKKMLQDEHLKVVHYEPLSSNVFPNTDIKGGIVVSYRDETKNYGAIGTFARYEELDAIMKKVEAHHDGSLSDIISSNLSFQLSDAMIRDYPDEVHRLRTNAFTALPIFHEEEPKDQHEYIKMYGLEGVGKRAVRFVRKDYVNDIAGTMEHWKLLVASACGAGKFGEVLSAPIVAAPNTGYTQTFIAVGSFDRRKDAEHVEKYVKTKFCRAMLDILKITHHCPGPTWRLVPLQDFTDDSDIDWSQSIHSIDQQLYKKYGLSEDEIAFIETKVKEMT